MAPHHRDFCDRMGLFNDESFIPDLVWPYRDTPFLGGRLRRLLQAPTQIAKQRCSAGASSDERQPWLNSDEPLRHASC
jgi:hypothetical protein